MYEIGKKFIYVARNSVFEIAGPPKNGYYLVYYPLTGEYRKYSDSVIARECKPYVKAPKRKRYLAPVDIIVPGFPNKVTIDRTTGVITCGCHVSTPNALTNLLTALKPLLKKVA